MIDHLYPINEDFPTRIDDGPLPGRQLGRLLSAAVLSEAFCDLLLRDAGKAISAGFQGEGFLLTNEELDLVLSIRATTIQQFACQLQGASMPARTPSLPDEQIPCDPTPLDIFVEVSQNTGLD